MLGQRIVAVVVPRDGRQPDPRAVQRACLDVLPRHKVPSEVRLVADLPRSDRGKLLRTVVRARLEAEAAGDLAPEPASVSERDTAL
jgi:acyl-CoA synthetase (AMP-forming)/AMP-acid ligase II